MYGYQFFRGTKFGLNRGLSVIFGHADDLVAKQTGKPLREVVYLFHDPRLRLEKSKAMRGKYHFWHTGEVSRNAAEYAGFAAIKMHDIRPDVLKDSLELKYSEEVVKRIDIAAQMACRESFDS